MKTETGNLAILLAATALLAGCTATTPQAEPTGSAVPSVSAPAPTVTVTVTASPEPAEPVSDELPDAPTTSRDDAVESCLDHHKEVGVGSELTGTPYSFLMHNGAWFIVIDAKNQYGELTVSCVLGGDFEGISYSEMSNDSMTPAWFDAVINGNGGM